MTINKNTIELGDITLDVVYKNIKNVHLSVHPPLGRVTISAPIDMKLDAIRLFGISKLGWIRKQQFKLKNQKRETVRDYVNRESHYYFGERYLLKIAEVTTTQMVCLNHGTIELHVKKGTSRKQKENLLQKWYKQQLTGMVIPLISKLEIRLNVKVEEIAIRVMKTKWGTCNLEKRRVCLNTELAKKTTECIEYILIHEMVHLLERNHNAKFISYMDKYLPKWKHLREELNKSALGHVNWGY